MDDGGGVFTLRPPSPPAGQRPIGDGWVAVVERAGQGASGLIRRVFRPRLHCWSWQCATAPPEPAFARLCPPPENSVRTCLAGFVGAAIHPQNRLPSLHNRQIMRIV